MPMSFKSLETLDWISINPNHRCSMVTNSSPIFLAMFRASRRILFEFWDRYISPPSTFGRVSVDRIINNAINYISGFLATIAVLSLMYGGVLYMTAGGDNGKIGKAKQVIVLTVVGLVIGSFAYMIVIFTTRLFYGS